VESLSNSVHAMLRLRSRGGAPARAADPGGDHVADRGRVFFQPLATDAGVQLSVQPAAPLIVPGDPSWLHQLFANLLHNAVKYTSAGGRVDVVISPDQEWVEVVVRDTGMGIDPEQASRVFEPFHRVAARPGTAGIGLGLPLAREIARAHGGEISLFSTPGSGSSFTVRLPMASAGG
jgi:signal transduction histidine kinase